jgi:putative lipoic acid-binding regulatory protein
MTMNDVADNAQTAESLIPFPSAFPLKIMGKAEEALIEAVLEIVTRHDPGFAAASMETRSSSGGNYISLTCTVTATSKPMLDALYRELTQHPLVKVVL